MELTIFGKKIPVVVLAVALVVAGAGAAAGITLAGNITGEQTTEVDSALEVEDVQYPVKDGMAIISSDGTEFSSATQVYQGDAYDKHINVSNHGQTDINARLTLDVDKPLQVELASDSDNIEVQRVGMGEWILNIDNDVDPENEGLTLTVAAPNDIEPGFYDMEGVLRPVEV